MDLRFNYIFNCMMGFVSEPDPEIPDEFEGECGRLNNEIYDARRRISGKLNGNLDGENDDALLIIRNYEKIVELLCRKSYQYGYQDGMKEMPD